MLRSDSEGRRNRGGSQDPGPPPSSFYLLSKLGLNVVATALPAEGRVSPLLFHIIVQNESVYLKPVGLGAVLNQTTTTTFC